MAKEKKEIKFDIEEIFSKLNPPNRIADTSWIHAGKASWNWWVNDADKNGKCLVEQTLLAVERDQLDQVLGGACIELAAAIARVDERAEPDRGDVRGQQRLFAHARRGAQEQRLFSNHRNGR